MIIFIVLCSYNCSFRKVTEQEQGGINALKNRRGPLTFSTSAGEFKGFWQEMETATAPWVPGQLVSSLVPFSPILPHFLSYFCVSALHGDGYGAGLWRALSSHLVYPPQGSWGVNFSVVRLLCCLHVSGAKAWTNQTFCASATKQPSDKCASSLLAS